MFKKKYNVIQKDYKKRKKDPIYMLKYFYDIYFSLELLLIFFN